MPERINKEENKLSFTEKLLLKLYSFLKIVFLLFLSIVLLYFIVADDKEMSESENRVLQKRPSLTLSAFLDGSFTKSFESWLSDQFPLRDSLVSLKTLVDRTTGKKEQNSVYFGKEGFLFEKQSAFDGNKVKTITTAVEGFLKKYNIENKAFIVSPNSSYVLKEYLPSYVEQPSQKQQLDFIKKQLNKSGAVFIDCEKIFSAQTDKTKLFYRTDHHWTTKAAYLTFSELIKQWDINTDKVKFDFYTVANDFEGTLSSASGATGVKDEVEICMPQKKGFSYVLNYESQGVKKATMFDNSKLETKNKYEVFLGGNFDKIEILTNNTDMDSLLIFKDSYANCMIPMLTPFFSKIVVIDPRYYSDDISSVMEENDFSHILFLYNLNTLLEDTSIEKLLG